MAERIKTKNLSEIVLREATLTNEQLGFKGHTSVLYRAARTQDDSGNVIQEIHKPGFTVVTRGNWVAALAIDQSDSTILGVIQLRAGCLHETVEIVAGHQEPGMTIEESVLAELREEAGVDEESSECFQIGSFYPDIAYATFRSNLFLVFFDGSKLHEQDLEEGEKGLRLVKVPVKEALENVRDLNGNPYIFGDSQSKMALLLAEPYLRERDLI